LCKRACVLRPLRPSSLQPRPVDIRPASVTLKRSLHPKHGGNIILRFMVEYENSSRDDTTHTLVIDRLMSLLICAPFFSKSPFVGNLICASSQASLKQVNSP
jgi:hypothetical protein